jgi:general secretion pathway protein D
MRLEIILKHGSKILFALFLLFAPQLADAQAESSPKSSAPSAGEEKKLIEEDEGFTINFEDVELEEIIKNFSQITGKNFILEEVPKGKITIISPIKMPKDQAFKVFEAILNLNGYNLAETAVPNLYRVVRTGEVMRANIPIYPEGRRPEVSDAFVTRFIPLEYLTAQDVANTIQPLLSKDGGNVVAYPPTNTLILVDTSLNIERILRIIKILDIPSEEAEFEFIYCRYALASELAGTLNQIFAAEQKTAQPKPTRTTKSRRVTRQTTTTPAVSQGVEIPLKIIPETRLNALILIGDKETLKEVKHVIYLLDVDVGEKGLIHVYYCKNAVASELAGTLASLAGAGRTTTRAATRSAKPVSETGTSSTRATVSSGAPASASLTEIFTGEVKITADEPTNSLIILASPQDYEIIKMVLEKLDIPRRQVFIEVALIDVMMTSGRSWNASMHGASPLEDEGVVLGASAYNSLNSLTLMSLLAQGVSIPSGFTVGALGKTVETPGGEISIPSVGVLLDMLASDSNVNVLSTPTILTMDNQSATIQVGERIPVPTGRTVSTGALSSISISRENVGIILNITPQINESGTIRLEISTEISGAVASALLSAETFGVTTSMKTVETTVVVKDAQTIIIGGLMKDSQDMSKNRIPFLGDIPVLGWLFKSQQKSQTKTNLVILLTPHIVGSDEDIKRVRDQIQKDYDSFIEENLGEKFERRDEYFGSRYEAAFAQEPEQVIDLTGEDEEIILPAPYESEIPEEIPVPEETAPLTEEGATVETEGLE